jgi:hypothetical protein
LKYRGKSDARAVQWYTYRTDGPIIGQVHTTAYVSTTVVKTTKKAVYVSSVHAAVSRGKDTRMPTEFHWEIDYDRLADLVTRKIEKKFLRMPKEWHDLVNAPYMLPPVQVPLYKRESADAPHYLIVEMYIPDSGGLVLHIKDEWGTQIAEKVFL